MDHRPNNRQLKNLRFWAAVAVALVAPAAVAQGVVKGDLAKAQPIVTQACAACHAVDGNSAIPANPNLAGQHPEYTYKQLRNFKSQGGKPAERSNGVMAGMVANLSDDDMKNLAVYFAAQKPKSQAARDAALAKQGESIYRGGIQAKGVAACASCHAPNGTGMPVHILLTKSDKLTRHESAVVLKRTEEELKQYPGEASAQIFSGANKTGVKPAQAVVARWLKK